MKQYLAVEEIDGHEYQLVFSARDQDDAEFLAENQFYAEFCGEITLSNVVRKSDLG